MFDSVVTEQFRDNAIKYLIALRTRRTISLSRNCSVGSALNISEPKEEREIPVCEAVHISRHLLPQIVTTNKMTSYVGSHCSYVKTFNYSLTVGEIQLRDRVTSS